MIYRTPQSSAIAVVTGGWLAKQTPERQLTALVAVAADQAAIDRLTLKQLALLAGRSENQFREARRRHGAPIRPKRPSARKTDPARAPANVDIIGVLRQLGTNGLLKLAELVERDEIARAAAAAKTNGNGAALNGGAVHHTW